MSKEFHISGMTVNIPDYKHSNVGKAIELIQNAYESGDLKVLFVVWATQDGVSRAIVGDHMVMPLVLMTASAVADEALDDIEDHILGRDTDDEGDEE